ncbi:MAG: DUF5674 family protein [bacterium]
MEIIRERITKGRLREKYLNYFKTLIKAVVDLENCVMCIDGELHADLEGYLLENGSRQEDIWGINLYPFKEKEDFIEYTALINIRPHQNNYSMEIKDRGIRERIRKITEELIDYES